MTDKIDLEVACAGDQRTAREWDLCILVRFATIEDVERYRGRYDDGWDAVRAARHELVLLVNTDVEFDVDAIERLAVWADQHPEATIVGPIGPCPRA